MFIYAGIDEAGYGPMFGPLVIARSVFAVEGCDAAGGPPCLWEMLEKAVCRRGTDRRRRIAVDDSKKLYTPKAGLGRLERGVLCFAHLGGHDAGTLDQLLHAVGLDDHCRVPDLLWYHDERGGPALPSAWTAEELAIARSRLLRCARPAGLTMPGLAAAVVYEDRFNRIVANTRSKAGCAWKFIAHHLRAIWQEHGERHPWVVIDRQGGRKVYHQLLQTVFESAEVRLLDESDDVSRYVLREGDRAMTVSFEIKSDARHLPVALASMTAKYLRELLMSRFNRFWLHHQPTIKPTAGYVQDGRRFLAEIEPLLGPLGIDRGLLVRSR